MSRLIPLSSALNCTYQVIPTKSAKAPNWRISAAVSKRLPTTQRDEDETQRGCHKWQRSKHDLQVHEFDHKHHGQVDEDLWSLITPIPVHAIQYESLAHYSMSRNHEITESFVLVV
jgi:ABC-type Zn2+ transport system substrate-binding protein/surface adhesin